MILGFAIEVLLFVVLFVLYHDAGRSASCRLECEIFCVISRAIPHKDCATDASSNFSSDETKSGVNT